MRFLKGKISERIQLRPTDSFSGNNGVLFKSDIHKLFDTGYVTISSDYCFEVSKRIKEEFENGKDYYAIHGRLLHLPPDRGLRPGSQYISWHSENVFRG